MKQRIIGLMILFIILLISMDVFASGSKVEVKRYNGRCILFVNERPFFIKGVGYHGFTPKEVTDKYFKMAKEMGANSIKQWGVAPNEKEILDIADKYGLMVNLGIWIDWNNSYIDRTEKQNREILGYVERFKDHPALLMWNLGNENIVKIKTEKEKIAFSKFIEEICKKIHKIDPNHPISYSGLVAEGIPYIKDYIPSIDIYGFNAYKAIGVAEEFARMYGLDRPYIYSEFGSDGWWEVLKDENGLPEEPDNYTKARQYIERWRMYIENKRECLGGFAFLFDGKFEETKTWWGITHEGLRTASFWALKKAYTGRGCPYSLPKVLDFQVSETNSIKAGSEIEIEILGRGKDVSYYLDAPETFGASWRKENGDFIYKVPSRAGVYRIYGIIKDNKGNINTVSQSIKIE